MPERSARVIRSRSTQAVEGYARPPLLLLISIVLGLSGCAGEDRTVDTWNHETGQEDGTTVVRTVSGSIWDGSATLEEELAIGIADGPEEYLFGRIRAIHARGDRIYLIDLRPIIIRVM